MTSNPTENRKQPIKWYAFIELKEWVMVMTGLLMVGIYSVTDMFINGVSSVVYHLTQGIYLFCCFIFLFFKLAIHENFQFGLVKTNLEARQDTSDNEDSTKPARDLTSKPTGKEPATHQEVQKGFKVKPAYVEAIFIPIRILTIIYLITNLLSGATYFYSTMMVQKKHMVIRQIDILAIDNLLSVQTHTDQAIIDSVNARFSKPIFFSAGKVHDLTLDTSGAFVYYFHLYSPPYHVSVHEWNVKIFNFTPCQEKLFCNCDSTNHCLRNKTIELYYLLVTRKTNKGVKPDTTYYSRIL